MDPAIKDVKDTKNHLQTSSELIGTDDVGKVISLLQHGTFCADIVRKQIKA